MTTPTRQDISPTAILAAVSTSASDLVAREAGGVALTLGLSYRSTGTPNVAAKALADTSAHAAPLLGIADASLGLRPWWMSGNLKMDCAPIVGAPIYLSATVEGKGSHAWSLGQVALWSCVRDTSVGLDYSCDVELYAPLTGPGDLEEYLDTETCSALGCQPWELDGHFEDFYSVKSSAGGEIATEDGMRSLHVVPASPSFMHLNGDTIGYYMVVPETYPALAGLCSVPWRISARLRRADTPNFRKNVFVGVWSAESMIVLGSFGDESASYWSLGRGTGNILYGAAVPSSVTHLAALNLSTIQLDIVSLGNNTFKHRTGGDWSDPIAESGTVTATNFGLIAGGAYAEAYVDWIYCKQKVR